MHQHTKKSHAYPPEVLDPSTILVGVDYVARLLGEEVGTIYNKSCAGRLPFPVYKSGSGVRFKYSQILEWVNNLQPIPARSKKSLKSKSSNLTKRGPGRPPKSLPVLETGAEKVVSL